MPACDVESEVDVDATAGQGGVDDPGQLMVAVTESLEQAFLWRQRYRQQGLSGHFVPDVAALGPSS